MLSLRSTNSFLVARYIVFGLFVISNAITCSVAAWNLSLVQPYPRPSQVDVYFIVLGALSLVSFFALVFVELLCINAITTRVWFECVWVTLFWIMELAGAAALIAIKSDIPCSLQGITFLNILCTSERVLLAFTWICTIILFVYLLTVVFLAASRFPQEPKIWHSSIRALRPATVRQSLSNTSTSPLAARFQKPFHLDTRTPHPPRSEPSHISRHRTGLSAQYEIEPFPPTFVIPEPMGDPCASKLREAIPFCPAAVLRTVPSSRKPVSALPDPSENSHASLSPLDLPTRGLLSSITYASSSVPLGRVPSHSHQSLPSPLPLGNWPRANIMQQPIKRKLPPPMAFEFPKKQTATIPLTERPSLPADIIPQPRSSRPSGPRLRMPSMESRHRPTPLDLSGISNHEDGGRDVTVLNV